MIKPSDATIHRISTAYALLIKIKKGQTIDGMSDLPHETMINYGSDIQQLLDAGFVRKINISEGGLPYRITWKGLSFIDTYELLSQVRVNLPPDSIQAAIAWLSVVSFH